MQVIYQLQRGPMLGEVAGHADERALLQTTFLAVDAPVALLMMAPALYVFNSAQADFQAVPALDLGMHTGDIVQCPNTCLGSKLHELLTLPFRMVFTLLLMFLFFFLCRNA